MQMAWWSSRWWPRLSGIVPLGIECTHVLLNTLGPDPAKTLVNELGLWSLRFLLATLCMTPLRWWTGLTFWTTWRRSLGLWAFAWALLHFMAYVVLLLRLDWLRLGTEIQHRPYILLGFLAWLLLLALAATSTKNWQRRLKQRWVLVHRAVYPATALALLHGSWVQKLSIAGFWPYLLIGLILATVRIVKNLQKK